MKHYFLGLSLLLLSASLSADDQQRGFYLGAGAALVSEGQRISVDLDDIDRRYRLGNVFAGYKHNSALGLELRYGGGLQTERRDVLFPDETSSAGAVPALARAAIDDYQSVYYRPELTNEIAKTYLLLGYSQVKTSGSIRDGQDNLLLEHSESDSGASYGLGIGFVLDRRFNLNFEYLVLLDSRGERLTTTGASIDYRF